jgi:hypothetical protein
MAPPVSSGAGHWCPHGSCAFIGGWQPPLKGTRGSGVGILHLDSMRVYNSRIKAQASGGGSGGGSAQSPFGVGLLVGALAVRSAWDGGCRKAELLAIKDNDEWHAKLVRAPLHSLLSRPIAAAAGVRAPRFASRRLCMFELTSPWAPRP